jgi:hypothetical protein
MPDITGPDTELRVVHESPLPLEGQYSKHDLTLFKSTGYPFLSRFRDTD